MHRTRIEGGGWSVADTARPAAPMTSAQVRSPGDGGQSHPSNGLGNTEFSESVPVKRGQHYYELQRSVFEQKQQQQTPSPHRSASQEELDKLLAGLDKLTETLPDLSSVRPYSSLSGCEKPIQVNGSESANPFSAASNHSPAQQRESRTPERHISLIRPSVVAKQSFSLQSRDTYDSVDSGEGNMSALTASQPYHTRADSKPFSYIRTNGPNSRGPSRNLSRASSREGLGQPGLESPGLLRKIMGTGTGTDSDSGSRPLSPAVTGNSLSSAPTSQRQFSIDYGSGNSNYANQQIYSVSRSPAPVQHSSLIGDASHMSDEEASMTWLQKQQRKLQDRRDAQRRRMQSGGSGGGPENDLMRELKTSLHRARSEMDNLHDGYVSDNASFRYSETSRESSPHKSLPAKPPIMSSTPKYQPKEEDSYLKVQSFQQSLQRQRSDSSFDRTRPLISRRLRYESETEDNNNSIRLNTSFNKATNGTSLYASNNSIDSFQASGGGFYSQPGSRPITPGFPNIPGTPSFNQSSLRTLPGPPPQQQQQRQQLTLSNGHATPQRAPSPAGSMYQATGTSRRGSISSEPAEVSPQNVKLVKDSHKFWYKPHISREEAIALLRHRSPGTFVVRDSNSFPGAFGLALKVSTPPVGPATRAIDQNSDELVRHFLIEPTSKGVKLKGYSNEPVFGSLSALVYQHTLTPLALPTKLILPSNDLSAGARDSIDSRTSTASQMQLLLSLGAACNVHYLYTLDTDSLTGPLAVKKAVGHMLAAQPQPTLVHFKVSSQGITLTDNGRKLFFRKHYNTPTISYCGLDPEDRRWTNPRRSKEETKNVVETSQRIFAFIARKPTSRTSNQCHVFAEQDPDQPARAIVNFVNKVLLNNSASSRSDVV